MRPTQPLLWNKWMRNGRRPARPPHRFTEVKRLVLKDSVSSGDKFSSELACNAQMMEMMACLKTHDFDEAKCSPQVTAYKQCYQAFLEKQKITKGTVNKAEPVPGQTKLTMSQVNSLLKRNPQPH